MRVPWKVLLVCVFLLCVVVQLQGRRSRKRMKRKKHVHKKHGCKKFANCERCSRYGCTKCDKGYNLQTPLYSYSRRRYPRTFLQPICVSAYNPCANMACPGYSKCEAIDGRVRCACPQNCPGNLGSYKPVCGTDGRTYKNQCELKRKSCLENTRITVARSGVCRVDGGWSRWSLWTRCAVSCGIGVQSRFRTCNNPTPSSDGRDCNGPFRMTRQCDTLVSCPVDGGWSPWSVWTRCSGQCGVGVQSRFRVCNNPIPSLGGQNCTGLFRMTRQCNTLVTCPVDGGWSSWSEWSECSGPCGVRVQERNRSCTNPRPEYGGKNCVGDATQSRRCVERDNCPVDGGWSEWGPWSECDGGCNTGEQARQRSCTNPSPKRGGKNCEGPSVERRRCRAAGCPVDGGWSGWSKWSLGCHGRCGFGKQYRWRSCTNPKPAFGGRACFAHWNESRICEISGRPCPVDGGWSNWTTWSTCSGRCGKGQQERRRSCISPKPAFGGRSCYGYGQEIRECDIGRPCIPVDGGWSEWSSWSNCNAQCGVGRQKRSRSCTNPRPMAGGSNCVGSPEEVRSCEAQRPCPVDGVWSAWSLWSGCRGGCGKGIQDRSRSCTNPRPQFGGRDCLGNSSESRQCQTGKKCNVTGVLGSWSMWGACSKSCHKGAQTRMRVCLYPPLRPGDEKIPCPGNLVESRDCNLNKQCKAYGCPGMTCKGGWVCMIIRDRPTCVRPCPQRCPMTQSPVCGSDGRTYGNACTLYAIACRKRTSLDVAYVGRCLQQYGKKTYG